MESSAAPVLTLKDIHLRYGDHVIFNGLSLQVNRGEVLGILGLIGAGKTRLLRIISQLEKPQSGEIRFSAPAHHERIGFIFQDDLLIPWLTIEENLEICRRSTTKVLPDDSTLIDTPFDVQKMLAMKPKDLSGGMRQKVNFARAISNHDPLILMDEPFSAFDPIERDNFLAGFLAYQYSNQTSAIFVTHNIEDALMMCDRIALLSAADKKIAATLTNSFKGNRSRQSLQADPSYRKIYAQIDEFYRAEGQRRR